MSTIQGDPRTHLYGIELERTLSFMARCLLRVANSCARKLNHEYLGTEHMLLALAMREGGVVDELMSQLSSKKKIRNDVMSMIVLGPEMVTIGRLPMTPKMKQAFNSARDFAEQRGDQVVDAEHLLVGLLRVENSLAKQVLESNGITEQIAIEKMKAIAKSNKKGIELDHSYQKNVQMHLETLKSALDNLNQQLIHLNGQVQAFDKHVRKLEEQLDKS